MAPQAEGLKPYEHMPEAQQEMQQMMTKMAQRSKEQKGDKSGQDGGRQALTHVNGDGWLSTLPDREREAVLSASQARPPAGYEDDVREYDKRLAVPAS